MYNNDSMFKKSKINFNAIQDSKQHACLKLLARSNETKTQKSNWCTILAKLPLIITIFFKIVWVKYKKKMLIT